MQVHPYRNRHSNNYAAQWTCNGQLVEAQHLTPPKSPVQGILALTQGHCRWTAKKRRDVRASSPQAPRTLAITQAPATADIREFICSVLRALLWRTPSSSSCLRRIILFTNLTGAQTRLFPQPFQLLASRRSAR